MILANEDMFPDPPSGVLGELDPPLKEPPCGIFKAVPACIDPSPSGNSKFVYRVFQKSVPKPSSLGVA